MAAAISAHKAASQTHFILESYIIQAGKIHDYTGLTAENSGILWWWWQGVAKFTPCQSHRAAAKPHDDCHMNGQLHHFFEDLYRDT